MSVRAVTRLVGVLLVVSAAAFVIGVAIERSRPSETHRETPAAATSTTGKTETNAASGETSTSSETPKTTTDSGHATKTSAAVAHSEGGETLLGIKTESTGLVVAAVVVSAALALGLWIVGDSLILLLAAALTGIVFAAFDVREATHQSNLSDTTLVIVALAVAALHLAVTAASGVGVRVQRRGARPV